MIHINRGNFFAAYRQHFGSMSQETVDGLNFLITRIEKDDRLNVSVGWIAYMLATVKHETGDRYQPIDEIGKGKGKPYGVPDASGRTWYGRGYVQLTWRENYTKMDERLKLGGTLLSNPDKAKEPAIAYDILSVGMIEGLYTGKKLNDYISDELYDFTNARRIVNGLDKAELIAGYAKKFQLILRQSIVNVLPPTTLTELQLVRKAQVDFINDVDTLAAKYGDRLNMMDIAACIEIAKAGIIRRWFAGLDKKDH